MDKESLKKSMNKMINGRTFLLGSFVIFSLVTSFLWFKYFVPGWTKIQEDFLLDLVLTSYDNFWDQNTKSFSGEVSSNSQFSYRSENRSNSETIVRSLFTVKKINGEVIFDATRLYSINPYSSEIIDKKKSDENIFLFGPRFFYRKPFKFMHAAYDEPLFMKFAGTEKIFSTIVDKYVGQINSDQTDNYAGVVNVPNIWGIRAQGEMAIWIEPVSGAVVKWEDRAANYYYDQKTKENLFVRNEFRNIPTESSIKVAVNQAAQKRNSILISYLLIPFLFYLAIFLIFTIWNFSSNVENAKNSIVLKSVTKRLYDIVVFLTPISTFLVSVLISLTFFYSLSSEVGFKKQVKLSFIGDDFTNKISQRIEIYQNALISASAFVNSQKNLDSETWHAYLKSIDIENQYPGFQAIGYAKFIEKKDVRYLESQMKNQGDTKFEIEATGGADLLLPVLYIEPKSEKNNQAIGRNLYLDGVRAEAINRALKTRKPQLTDKVFLLTENINNPQPGFVIYSPVIESGTVEDNSKVTGFTFAAFRVKDFLSPIINVINADIDFAIFSGQIGSPSEKSKLFDSSLTIRNFNKTDFFGNYPYSIIKTTSHTSYPWTLLFTPKQNFALGNTEENFPNYVLFGGIFAGLILSIIVYLLVSSKNRAEALADKITSSLKNKNQENEEIQQELIKAGEDLENTQDALKQKINEIEESNRELEETKIAVLNILEDLQESNIVTEQQAQLLNSLLINLPLGVILFDSESEKINLINPAAEKLFSNKVSLDPQTNSKIITADFYHADNTPFTDKTPPFLSVANNEESRLMDNIYLKNDQGEKVFLRIRTVAIKSADGKVNSVVAVFEDITNDKRIDQMKTDFISLASHQLRTPLSAIRWFVEMLMNGDVGKLTGEQMGLVGNISQSTIRMIDLVNALLDVSRIEAGHISVNPEPTDLKELINQVLIELQNSINSKKLKLHFSIEDALPSISLDPKLARQVYMNLLTNAIKYTHENGEINISISRNGSKLQSEISDNGIGIPEKDLPKICEKFFRAPNAAKFDPEGNGLGMYLVKSIVNSLGGDFSIESQEGKGTLVKFSFLIN